VHPTSLRDPCLAPGSQLGILLGRPIIGFTLPDARNWFNELNQKAIACVPPPLACWL
jgi:hypothetical protein